MSLMISSEEKLTAYISDVLKQVNYWLEQGELEKLVLVVTSVASKEVLERWTFDIQVGNTSENQPPEEVGNNNTRLTDPTTTTATTIPGAKTDKEIQTEIGAIIRQITASVTFLPLLDEHCAFDLLVYTKKDADVPQAWEESDPRYVTSAAEVKLRSFSTSIHKVESCVAYKQEDD